MKAFERFHHTGVRADLEALRDYFVARGAIVGSSHDGEITLKRRDVTVYARKYRNRNMWRIRFWGSARHDANNIFFERFTEVVECLKQAGL